MLGPASLSLQQALTSLSLPGLLIDCRPIADGDEFALLKEEAESMVGSSVEARRASGTARILARDLLARLGFPRCALPKGPTGSPLWPVGITGSLSHNDGIAVAAVGSARGFGSIGIDIESAEPLAPDMIDLVATAHEQLEIVNDPLRGKLLFAAKEAVYKAVHPLDGLFLEFHDIEVDLTGHKAVTRHGRAVELLYRIAAHQMVALARA
jgi:4'-phosphopantetheinyl transferase EntD